MTAYSSTGEYATGEHPVAAFSMAAAVGLLLLAGGAVKDDFTSLAGPTEGATAEFSTAEFTTVVFNSYSLIAERGAFAFNGQTGQARVEGRAAAASFTLAGQPAHIVIPHAVGSYSLNGQATFFRSAAAATRGLFSLSGYAGHIAQPVTFGSFTLSGQPAVSIYGIVANRGVYSLTGQPFSASYEFTIGPSEGSTAEYGTAEFPREITFGLYAALGQFNTAGQVSLAVREDADTGLFALAGGQAGIAWPVPAGQFAFTGQPTVLRSYIAATRGLYTLAGGQAGIAWPVPAGSFVLNGQPALGTASLQAARGIYSLAGQQLQLLFNAAGLFTLTGQASDVDFYLPSFVGSFSLAGQAAKLPIIYIHRVDAGAFTLTGGPAGVGYIYRPQAGLFNVTFTGSLRTAIVVGAGVYNVAGYTAGYGRSIEASTGLYSIIGWPVADVIGPSGDHIFLVEIDAHDGSGIVRKYLGSEDWRSAPFDTPSNQHYESRVQDAGNFERHLFSQGATRGKSEAGYGDIVVLSGDPGNGALIDDWLGYGWSGRQISIKAIPPTAKSLSAAATLFRGRLDRIESTDPLNKFNLKLGDRLTDLQNPLLTERYAGTTTSTGATAEGNADLKGQIKQRVWGSAFNVPLQPANVYDLIYVASAGPCAAIALKDGGVALTNDGDSANIAALQAATIAPGHYRTCLALGLIRLGGQPVYSVTADVVEGATSADRTVPQIAYRMLLHYGIPSNQIITGSFSALDAKNSAEADAFVNDERSALDAVQEVLDSIGAYLVVSRDGSFEVGRFEEPIPGPRNQYDLEDQAVQDSLDRIDGEIPVWRVNIQGSKNHKVLSDGEIAGAVSAGDRARLTSEYRTETAEDASIKLKHLNARELTFTTNLVDPDDMADEAERLLQLHKVEREQYQLVLPLSDGWQADVGQAVLLTHPRLGMASGKAFNVIGRSDEYESERISLRVWG